MRVEMNATWVAVAVVVPLVAGLLVAGLLWRARVADEMAAIAGSGVVLAFVIAHIAREYGEVLAVTARCVEANVGCRFHPEPFTRYAIYGGIGMCQVFAIFAIGLLVEERLRTRDRRAAQASSRGL